MTVRAASLTLALLLSVVAVSDAQQNRDSVEVRRRAINAQARFESVRRINLPVQPSGGGDNCDARIGRFCQWNDDTDTIEAKMPRVIRRAREALLASLDSLAKKSPRDGWITGQRIRYLIEMKNDSAALRVAHECRAAEWWCSALAGLAYHELRRGVEADSAFAHALRTMPASERCRWTDMTPLLDPTLKSRYKKVGCGKNEDVAEKLWWLADPFWSRAGNERRAEHYARHTMAKIQEPARNPYNLSWSNDLREMVVRYGWARYWTRGYGSTLEPRGGAISGHEATPNYHFVPVSLTLDSVPKPGFDLDLDNSSERYSPSGAKRLVEIEPQVAIFRRGDSALVVAAYDVYDKKNFDTTAISAALVLSAGEKSPPRIAQDSGRRGAIVVTTESSPQLMSLEVMNAGERGGVAWKRVALPVNPAPSGISLSDPLIFTPDGDVHDLESAMRFAIGSNTVRREKIGVYWETYGLQQSDSTQPVSLTLTRVQPGLLQRLGESIGLSSRMSPLKIQWNQVATGTIAFRALILDLALIPRGRYVLRIETGGAVSSRNLEIQ
jgi:hypothetical protein